MSDEIFDAMLERIINYCERRPGHRIGLSLHGGEPLLVGKVRLTELVERARARLGPHLSVISVQTNATLVDKEWAFLLNSLGVSVGVSIDGPAEVHDVARPDLRGRGSHARTLQGLRRLQAAGFNPIGLCVINPEANGGVVYEHLRALGLQRIDLLLPDVSHDTIDKLRGDPQATPVADYLIAAAERWLAENNPEVEVRILYGLFRKLMGGELATDAFGNPRLSYLVVETDGEIEGNDVLKVCADGLAATGLNVMLDSFDDLTMDGGLIGRMVHLGLPLSTTCTTCPDVAICGGGYVPHRWSSQRGFDNPSAWCADIRLLLSYLRQRCESALAAQ